MRARGGRVTQRKPAHLTRRVPTARESAALGTLLAFILILWLNSGNLSSKFQNILLFTAYWIAPFLAIIVIDWYRRGGSISREGLARLMRFTNLSTGWPALAALVVGFAAMVRFMNTGLVVGPVANALRGADLSFYAGFLVAAIVYSALCGLHRRVGAP
jgi:NCS1 family nucleobase:cation symporter-1